MGKIGIEFAVSFFGSLAALVFWFHYDMDARWQHRKVENGRRRDERATRLDAESDAIHRQWMR
jgi:hypothetical protein